MVNQPLIKPYFETLKFETNNKIKQVLQACRRRWPLRQRWQAALQRSEHRQPTHQDEIICQEEWQDVSAHV